MFLGLQWVKFDDLQSCVYTLYSELFIIIQTSMKLTIENINVSIFDPQKNSIYTSKLITHLDEWTILFFYPADFSVICPTELQGIQKSKEELEGYGARILVISRDSHYTHQQWVESNSKLKDFSVEMVSDRDAEIGKELCIYLVNKETKNFERISIIVDRMWNVLSFDFSPEKIWRNIEELVRKIKAMRHILDNPDSLCPEHRTQGTSALKDTIQPGKNTMFSS